MSKSNVSRGLSVSAEKFPGRTAVIAPGQSKLTPGRAGRPEGHSLVQYSWTFAELSARADLYAWALRDFGINKGERALVMISPGFDFVAVSFAILKAGIVPVYIDPGMGLRALKQCIADARPSAFIAIPLAYAFAGLFPGVFGPIRKRIVLGSGFPGSLFGARSLSAVCRRPGEPFPAMDVAESDEAIIAFTSGSTGIPKGVIYTHPMLHALKETLREEIGIREQEVDFPILPIFALFNPALGVATVIPDMNPSKVLSADPARLVRQIRANQVTTTFGSPTVWKKIAAYCHQRGLQLPSIKRILIAGAPVPVALLEQLAKILPNGRVLTPYGATEAIALTLIAGGQILEEASRNCYPSRGVCVGRPLKDVFISIIPIADSAIETWDPGLALPPGAIGEIVARGPVVTHAYLNRPQETRFSKIVDQGQVMHRMGDIGYLDDTGRLWFCGRKSHRVETAKGLLLPIPCEAVFNRHPGVERTALVGVGEQGSQLPVLVVERRHGAAIRRKKLIAELLALGRQHEHTKYIKDILFHPHFPMDVRHNAKIQREKLRQWAQKKIRG